MLVRILSNEIVLSSSNTTVNNAVVVRLTHTGAQSHFITIYGDDSSLKGSFTILNDSVIMLEKKATDTLVVDSGSDVLAVSVAYKN